MDDVTAAAPCCEIIDRDISGIVVQNDTAYPEEGADWVIGGGQEKVEKKTAEEAIGTVVLLTTATLGLIAIFNSAVWLSLLAAMELELLK